MNHPAVQSISLETQPASLRCALSHAGGREEGLRSALLALLHAKLDVVTADDQAAIEAMHDERALTELIGVLGRATSAPEVRAALTALRAGG